MRVLIILWVLGIFCGGVLVFGSDDNATQPTSPPVGQSIDRSRADLDAIRRELDAAKARLAQPSPAASPARTPPREASPRRQASPERRRSTRQPSPPAVGREVGPEVVKQR